MLFNYANFSNSSLFFLSPTGGQLDTDWNTASKELLIIIINLFIFTIIIITIIIIIIIYDFRLFTADSHYLNFGYLE